MAQLTKAELLSVLADLVKLVEADDSMEGRLRYEWSSTPGEYEVDAFLRVGNSQGQGGAIVIQATPPPDRGDRGDDGDFDDRD
jgi:hypothetical protein